MLSDKFQQLLDIQEERFSAIRAECAPFAAADNASGAVHKRVVDDMDQLLSLTQNFRTAAATAQTTPDKQTALKTYGEASKISMELSGYLFSNSQCAGAFRNAALQKHGPLINTIAREQVLTCVNTGWALIEGILQGSKAMEHPAEAPTPAHKPGAAIVMLHPRK